MKNKLNTITMIAFIGALGFADSCFWLTAGLMVLTIITAAMGGAFGKDKEIKH